MKKQNTTLIFFLRVMTIFVLFSLGSCSSYESAPSVERKETKNRTLPFKQEDFVLKPINFD